MMPFHTEDAIDDNDYSLWAMGSLNKNQGIMNDVINACNPGNITRVAGAGNKIIHMLD